MNWMYKGEPMLEMPTNCIGFVYLITDHKNNMLYVGKKLAITTRKLPPLKGKKNKRHKRIDTDWQTYWGSSDKLTAQRVLDGAQHFSREILHLCANKNTMSYLECKEQFDRNVLMDDQYYNGIIHCRVSARGLDGII